MASVQQVLLCLMLPCLVFVPCTDGTQEVVDIQTDWRGDNSVLLNFTSHGRHHHLHLTESRVDLSQVPVKLLGSNDEQQRRVTDKLKTLKMMSDKRRRATVAFQTASKDLTLSVKTGVFNVGKYHFIVDGHTSLGKVKVTRLEQNYNKLLKDMEVYPQQEKRQRRSVDSPRVSGPINATVELVLLADYKLWLKVSEADISVANISDPHTNCVLYFAHIVSAIDTYYSTVRSNDLQISIKLAGIVIITSKDLYKDLVEDHVVQGRLDSWTTLNRFGQWIENDESVLPPHDHVMLVTGYDMFNQVTDSQMGGIAYNHNICHKRYSCSIIEMGSITLTALLASHELGHNLGAAHDGVYGSSAACPQSKYVMDSDLGDKTLFDYTALFSCCAQRSFYSIISREGGCLYKTSATPNVAPIVDRNLASYQPGEVYTENDQCYVAFGTTACTYQNIYDDRGTDLCQELWCISPKDPKFCVTYFSPAADGTNCGQGRWCQQGHCVDEGSRVTPTDQQCAVTSCFAGECKCHQGNNSVWLGMGSCYECKYKCDGLYDCTDRSDETGCSSQATTECPQDYYSCVSSITLQQPPDGVSRICLHKTNICDGIQHCADNSDETQYCGKCYTCGSSEKCLEAPADCTNVCPQTKECPDILNYKLDIQSSSMSGKLYFNTFLLFFIVLLLLF